MHKRILAIALVLAVLVGVAVFTAAAEGSRNQCVCGGKAAGKPGHTCQSVTFEPWTSTTSLPRSGNYYLTGNVTISNYLLPNGALNLDLNGYNITRKVTGTSTTQVFAIASNHSLSITDSTANPGTVSRDLSALTEDAQKSINNWGLLIIVNKGFTGSLNLYDGIYDSTGCYSYGGSVISNSSTAYPINIYGGTLRGGITTHNGTSGGAYGAVYSASNVNMYGGEITGATLISRPGVTEGSAGLYTSATLTIGGNAKIYGNHKKTAEDAAAEPNNVYVTANTKLVFSGTYTGTIGIVTAGCAPSQANGVKVASTSSANTAKAVIHLDDKPGYRAYNAGSIYQGQYRMQCECGGKAEGKPGHTCTDLEFIAWNHNNTIPTSGNWYLTTGVTYTAARRDVSNNTLRIDLNGKNLIRKVGAGTNACMFGMSGSAHIAFTDSTDTPGTVTRDLSAFGSTSCGNYGLITYIDKSCTNGSLTLYGGILETTGTSTTGSGSVIYNGSATTTVNIYGGEMKAGTANNGAIYSVGPVVLMGGKISGSTVINTASAAVDMSGGGRLTLGGNPVVTGNTLSSGTPANIKITNDKQLVIKGTFTGDVTITPFGALTVDAKIGTSEDAVLQGKVALEGYPDYSVRIAGTELVVGSGYGALVDAGMNTYYYDTLEEAVEHYEGGKAVIKLLDDAADARITITQETYIDLNGRDIGSVNVASGTLYLYDSQTDDFTIEDGRGYGKVGSVAREAKALPAGQLFKNGYMLIGENDGVSFHRLNITPTAVTLRATDIAANGAAVYYRSTFGGDEVIRANIKAFGIAMGAGQMPDFSPKTFTEHTDLAAWESGKLNAFCGTLLKDIMKLGETDDNNSKNAATQVYSQAYIELLDGTRILSDVGMISLQQILEGTETATGVDGLWVALDDVQKQAVTDMFNAFRAVMSQWKIPYIKNAITGEEIPFDDDGILKVLLIGHSLGLDSGYFFPEVYKESTGKDVVLGMLYHSGCRLNQHVGYINGNIKQYAYYEFDTRTDTNWRRADARITEDAALTFHPVEPSAANDTMINDGIIGVTMKDGITRADWDVVILQAGVFDAAGKQDDPQYAMNTTADIQTIRQYVLDNDIEKRSVPEFAWNITWASPSKNASFWDSTANYVNVYRRHNTNFYWQYGKDANDMYADIAAVYQTKVTAAGKWDYLMPSGTALHSAKSVMADELLYRDVIHSTDFGRLMFAYIWTCQLEGKTMDDFPEITSIYSQMRYNTADRRAGDYVLNNKEQAILRKAVDAALRNPLSLTDLSN